MGCVFEAQDSTGRRVAIKLLHPELSSDREMHRRFKREGSILKALNHPAVVRVHEVGQDELDRAYIVMDLLDGETLRTRILRSPLTPEDAVPVCVSICEGLHAAHSDGVLHGDIKPENVFVLPNGKGKLVDFGTSKVHGLDRLTRTGEVIGTPTYMAPELLTGQVEIDERIDIYSLGIVLYESLVGLSPFRERNPGKLLMQIVTGKGEPIEKALPTLSPALVEIIHTATTPDPASRYTDVLKLRDALAHTLER